MRTYEVECEGLVSRRITIEAKNGVEAWHKAKAEFAALTGADRESVAVVDVYTEVPKFVENQEEDV